MTTRVLAAIFVFTMAAAATNFASLDVARGVASASRAAQQAPAVPAGQGQGGRGGGAAAPAPPVPSVSKRPNGGGLATIRMGAPDNNMWFGWRVALPTAAFRGLTFSDALAKADLIPVASVEAVSTQITSFEVPKPLDQRLQSERA